MHGVVCFSGILLATASTGLGSHSLTGSFRTSVTVLVKIARSPGREKVHISAAGNFNGHDSNTCIDQAHISPKYLHL